MPVVILCCDSAVLFVVIYVCCGTVRYKYCTLRYETKPIIRGDEPWKDLLLKDKKNALGREHII